MKHHLLDSSPSYHSQQPARCDKASKKALARKAKDQVLTNSRRIRTIADEISSLIETMKDLADEEDLSGALAGTKRRRAEK